ncbi:hypothetical protein SAMN04487906_3049 [Zhouia amylolytica]|uniref:Transmembrane protein n=2 Tax=Zhouia amylolytica TaxID=376730 RepID=W2ULV8_9FLAO|nr:hypothetical protein [Zhouia amylolytica]ETN94431.1 hypothetical protein P278_23740 [Zhouia amylolytica AD3]MCQ0110344.1 hypothetical protein [Zhouia amylolytica]SFT12025.1 hypothetical protein SAMN04487906_3049 [Zhouia amylolytica]
MQKIAKVLSFIFHPLFTPIAGTIIFFIITPKYTPPEIIRPIFLSILIISVFIPIVLLLLFKNLGWISSIYLDKVEERKIPIYAYIALNYIIILKVIPFNLYEELYYFLVGIVGALVACVILVYFKFKASLHLMAISSLTTFIIGLAFHYEINITFAIATLIFLMGLIASARMYLRTHNMQEMIVGFIIGFIPQLITFNSWL